MFGIRVRLAIALVAVAVAAVVVPAVVAITDDGNYFATVDTIAQQLAHRISRLTQFGLNADTYSYCSQDDVGAPGVTLPVVRVAPNLPAGTVMEGIIVLITGINDACARYNELFFDFQHVPVVFLCYEQRGQGLATRLRKLTSCSTVDNSDSAIYLDSMDKAVADLGHMLDIKVWSELNGNKYGQVYARSTKVLLLGHDLGGLTALTYLQSSAQNRAQVAGAFLVSPITAFYTGKSEAIIDNKNPFSLHNMKDIMPGNLAYNKQSTLTNCIDRAVAFNNATLYPHTLGVTWKAASVFSHAGDAARSNAASLSGLPIRVLVGGADTVQYDYKDTLCQDAGASCQSIVYPNAQHDLLLEVDSVRNDALHQLCALLNSVGVTCTAF